MNEVNACIITIGDELLIGQTIDTNSAFIAQELNAIGVWVKRRVAVGDIKTEILTALREESAHVDLVIITGGLGPTADDITKPTLCEYFETTLVENEEARDNVIRIFKMINRPLTDRNLSQAYVPAACTVLQNKRGSAPGMWFEKNNVVYVSLPGVPHEMKGLVMNEVLPRLKKKFELQAVVHRTLLTSGIGESTIADHILSFEKSLPSHVKLAYLPSFGLVRLRLTGRSSQQEHLENELDGYFAKLQTLVEEWVVAIEDIPLEEALNRLLAKHKKTVATGESCTGGNIAHLITSRAGSSKVYKGSVVAYANEIKTAFLSVNENTITTYGAVSEETVKEMASGLLRSFATDYVLATSGIMGPDGGSPEKPVGTVWIAVGNAKEIRATKYFARFDRERNIEVASYTALTLLYRFIKEAEEEGTD